MSQDARNARIAGIFCHISSLQGGDGMGALGQQAKSFASSLAQAGFGLWQVLPLNPTDDKGSPYLSTSAFAGNTNLIDLDGLATFGFSPSQRLAKTADVDLGNVVRYRTSINPEITKWFRGEAGAATLRSEFEDFVKDQADWLDDFALFTVIRKSMFDLAPWWSWPHPIRDRDERALAQVRENNKQAIEDEKILQFLFDRQWRAIKGHANSLSLRILGDLPIYVSADSSDVWANPEIFQLDDQRQPTVVAGVPPDYFAKDGQLWGNPIYDWDALQQTGYAWWKRRIAHAADLYDLVRIDHFRAFADYWAVPKSATTARDGTWQRGPGAALIEALGEVIDINRLVAEDLGEIDNRVLELRDQFTLPGMAVAQFAFDGNSTNPHHFSNHCENVVAYLSTHDNPTTMAWLQTLEPWQRKHAADGANQPHHASDVDLLHGLMRNTMASRAKTAVICLQDTLALGDEATMNRPGIPDGNWAWRIPTHVDVNAALQCVGQYAQDNGRGQ